MVYTINTENRNPVVGRERFGAFGVPICPIYSLFNGEPRSYLEFPNHLIDRWMDGWIDGKVDRWMDGRMDSLDSIHRIIG